MTPSTDLLKNVPLFQGLKDKELKQLATTFTERKFSPGQDLTAEGGTGVGFFVIDSGSATVKVGDEVRRTLGPGDYFGEIALIDDGPRSATVVATAEMTCRGMAPWEFKAFLAEHPEAAWAVMQTLVRHLRESDPKPGEPTEPGGE